MPARPEPADLARLEALHADLLALREHLGAQTYAAHRRRNPFVEDLVDWQQKGREATGSDAGVTVYDSATIIGDVHIGAATWVGPFTLLDGSGGLSIGHHCAIGTGAQVLTHDTIRWSLSGGRLPYEYAATRIGDCCFLSNHAIVLPGVAIEDHCVILAGAVVTANVPRSTVVAGVPARRVGRVNFDGTGKVNLLFESTARTGEGTEAGR